jgi:hypothetical protein
MKMFHLTDDILDLAHGRLVPEIIIERDGRKTCRLELDTGTDGEANGNCIVWETVYSQTRPADWSDARLIAATIGSWLHGEGLAIPEYKEALQ